MDAAEVANNSRCLDPGDAQMSPKTPGLCWMIGSGCTSQIVFEVQSKALRTALILQEIAPPHKYRTR